LSEDNVAELLGRYAHEKAAAEALVAAANAAGGRDNITCVLVRVR
jgi:serine/threonine protein phosphatase PrpC